VTHKSGRPLSTQRESSRLHIEGQLVTAKQPINVLRANGGKRLIAAVDVYGVSDSCDPERRLST
jgi:hypothetical protein